MEVLLQQEGRNQEYTYKGSGGKPAKVEWRRRTTRTGEAGSVAAERAAKASRTNHKERGEQPKAEGESHITVTEERPSSARLQ